MANKLAWGVAFVGFAFGVACSESSTGSGDGGTTNPGPSSSTSASSSSSSGGSSSSSGGSTTSSSGGQLFGFPLGCELNMPISGAVTGTITQTSKVFAANVFLGDGPAPFEASRVYLIFPKPKPTEADNADLDSVQLEFVQGTTTRQFKVPAGGCKVTISEVRTGPDDRVAYKGSGACNEPAVEQLKAGADAGEPGEITISAFTFANTF